MQLLYSGKYKYRCKCNVNLFFFFEHQCNVNQNNKVTTVYNFNKRCVNITKSFPNGVGRQNGLLKKKKQISYFKHQKNKKLHSKFQIYFTLKFCIPPVFLFLVKNNDVYISIHKIQFFFFDETQNPISKVEKYDLVEKTIHKLTFHYMTKTPSVIFRFKT